ncbi:DUF2637 domain-containing protein [Streptomyces sp. DSM 41527]|uniref:DUF2637 domain-containing protein n=1 Tax=Streptomyces mooreae TaxID=3075523 RepID=A0ABU2TDN6_9ACTN|nr:DUF2637 domain-containing protein [Streptomyces sp. DSM 41527]MDT0459067.1 DUF2637 domain-containing protein [Streptomyces sp. DSM 41527]
MGRIRPDPVLVQAVIAGALSFAHLHDLAAAAGQDGWKAWAYPISVDLLLVAAWRRLRNDGSSRLAWCWFLIALVASLGANVATAGFLDLRHPPAWLRFGIAGWPALAFLGGTLLAHTRGVVEAADTTPLADMAPAPAPVPDPVPTVGPPTESPELEVAGLPAAEPPTEPPRRAPAPAPVPAALVAHARKVADEHHARTGEQIDTDTLRARLGVPPQLADSIAAQLT